MKLCHWPIVNSNTAYYLQSIYILLLSFTLSIVGQLFPVLLELMNESIESSRWFCLAQGKSGCVSIEKVVGGTVPPPPPVFGTGMKLCHWPIVNSNTAYYLQSIYVLLLSFIHIEYCRSTISSSVRANEWVHWIQQVWLPLSCSTQCYAPSTTCGAARWPVSLYACVTEPQPWPANPALRAQNCLIRT